MATTRFDRIIQSHGPAAWGSRRGLLAKLDEPVSTTGSGSVADSLVTAAMVTAGRNDTATANHGTPTGCTFGVTAITDGGGSAVRLNGTTDRIQFANEAEFRAAFDFDQEWTVGWWYRANITRSGTVTQITAACQEAAGDFRGLSLQTVHAGGATLLRIQLVRNLSDLFNFQTNALDLPNDTDYFVTFSHRRVGGNHEMRITATPKSGSTVAAESAAFAAGAATDVASSITTTAVFQLGCHGDGSTNGAFGAGDFERLFFEPRYLPIEALQQLFDAGKADAPAPVNYMQGLGEAKGFLVSPACHMHLWGDSTSNGGDTNVGDFMPKRLAAALGLKRSGVLFGPYGGTLITAALAGRGPIDIDAGPAPYPNATAKRGMVMLQCTHQASDPAADTLELRLVRPFNDTINHTVITRPRFRWIYPREVAAAAPVTKKWGGTIDGGSTDHRSAAVEITVSPAVDHFALDVAPGVTATGTIEPRAYSTDADETDLDYCTSGCLVLDDADLTGLICTGCTAKDGTQISQHSDNSTLWSVNRLIAAGDAGKAAFIETALAGLTIAGKVAWVRLDINGVNGGFSAATMLGAMQDLHDLLIGAGFDAVVFEQAWPCWLSPDTSASSRVPLADMAAHWADAYLAVAAANPGTCGVYSGLLFWETVPFYLLEIQTTYAIHARDAVSAYALTLPAGLAMSGTEAVMPPGSGGGGGVGRLDRVRRLARELRV